MKDRFCLLVFGLLAISSPSAADDYGEAYNEFIEFVRDNPATAGGSWLEISNALGEWEKVVLIFGYFDPGDQVVCEEIRALAASENPERRYRCNPVD
ncbi:MAG: hypothetical protein JJ938_10730 [Roseicyclus sp.]|nr:hypothetical protein [Roseicyclus sp.]MBO6625347.1 hypothetical protein [Roseicyclus sp.]MBO6922684.1 hypothetical protein [Roseicyclus sp.]